MHPERLKKLLQQVRSRGVGVDQAMRRLKSLPFEDIAFAKVDHHRALRRGFPEVIFCQGKAPKHVVEIVGRLAEAGGTVLATRADRDVYRMVQKKFPRARYHEMARMIVLAGRRKPLALGPIAVVTAGSADIPVAEEAVLTAEAMGCRVQRVFDVGVAGIHRLMGSMEDLNRADVLVVVAGMEGALPSVVAGLVDKPAIAVPTSVGYGTSLGGLAALLGMLNGCSSGMTVVNIDNGFGAGYSAALISRLRHAEKHA